MRANDQIVQGDFLGGEIEGGTFHCGLPDYILDRMANRSGSGTASDERASAERPTATVAASAVNSDASTDLEQEVTDPQA
jgi:hypothetical protein